MFLSEVDKQLQLIFVIALIQGKSHATRVAIMKTFQSLFDEIIDYQYIWTSAPN